MLIGAAGAAIWEARGGTRTDISTDIIHELHDLHPTHYVEQSGYPSNVGAEFVEVNGIFPTRDGRYIMLEAAPPYQKLLNGYLNFFDCGNSKQSFAREVAKWNAEDLGRRAMMLCAGNRRCTGGLARGAAGQAEGMS